MGNALEGTKWVEICNQVGCMVDSVPVDLERIERSLLFQWSLGLDLSFGESRRQALGRGDHVTTWHLGAESGDWHGLRRGGEDDVRQVLILETVKKILHVSAIHSGPHSEERKRHVKMTHLSETSRLVPRCDVARFKSDDAVRKDHTSRVTVGDEHHPNPAAAQLKRFDGVDELFGNTWPSVHLTSICLSSPNRAGSEADGM